MTVDKIIQKINDFLGYSGTDTTIEQNQKISALNSAISFLLGEIDFDASIRTHTIEFTDQVLEYNLPSDFVSLISLRYEDSAPPYVGENSKRDWIYENVGTITKLSYKPSDAVLFAVGGKKIYILTSNIYAPEKIDSCDNTTGWIAEDDAVNLGINTAEKKEGNASIKFDIDVSNSPVNRASLKKTFSFPVSWKHRENIGSFTLWLFIRETTNLSSISFNWGTDAANYYKTTVNSQYDGSPFVIGWNFLKFNWKDATIIGSPNPENISFIKIDIDYTSSFTSSNNWLLDDINLVVYDPIVVTYYSNKVVRDVSGNLKSSVESITDDVLIVDDELTLSTIALLAIQHYRGASLVDKSYIGSLYQAYFQKLKVLYPPRKIFRRFGRIIPPLIR